MNRRHKTILFLTLVMTGSSLLAGATLAEGLGILILGAALAWLVGSETASRGYRYLRKVPGKMWPWSRALLLMVLAGCLLVGVALWSNFDSFLVVVAMGIFAMLFSPLFYLPTERSWLRVVGGTIAIVVFFLAAVLTFTLSGTAQQNSERIGELMVPGLIAIPIGTSWLARGWRLLLKGISADDNENAALAINPEAAKGTTLVYISLCAGTIVLTLCLSLLLFSSFSHSVFRSQVAETTKSLNGLAPLWSFLFLILLAWWPFACWKRILKREPNTMPANVNRHMRVTAVLGGLFSIILCVAITFGIQNGYDRKITARVEEGRKNFINVATKIGAIKRRELRTTDDYIEAYSEMEPLEAEFDAKLQNFTDILSEVKQRNGSRGAINIQRLYSKQSEWMKWDEQIFGLLRQDNELTKKQVLAAKEMASLPGEYQPEFWKNNFRPLLVEEDTLRQKIASAQKSMPTSETK